MKTVHYVVAILVLSSIPAITSAQETSYRPLTGRLKIEGVEYFHPKQVVKKVVQDFDVVLANHPSAKDGELHEAIREKITIGYQLRGFAKAHVDVVEGDDGQIIATVTEGPQIRGGKIVVHGANRVSVQQLKKWLKSKRPSDNAVAPSFQRRDSDAELVWVDKDGNVVVMQKPVWKEDRLVPFNKDSQDYIRSAVGKALKDLGFPFARYIAETKIQENQRADLIIKIEDEGPLAEVSEILVDGNARNSDQEIIDFLNIKPGMLFTERKRLQLSHALWKSGRFIKSEIRPLESFSPDEPIKLKIVVQEYDRASRLTEPLVVAEKAMLKLRSRTVAKDHDSDFILSAANKGHHAEIVISTSEGVAGRYRNDGSADGTKKAEYAISLSNKSLAFYSTEHSNKLVIPTDKATLLMNFGLKLEDNKQTPNTLQRFMFALGLNSKDSGRIRLNLNFAPVFFVALAHEHSRKLPVNPVVNANVVTTESKNARMRVNAETGKLIELVMHSTADKSAIGQLRIEPGEYKRITSDIQKWSGRLPNAYDPKRPVSSVIGFFLKPSFLKNIMSAHDIHNMSAEDVASIRVIHKLVSQGLLVPLDEWSVAGISHASKLGNLEDQDFTVPTGHNVYRSRTKEENFLKAIGRTTVLMADELFQHETWPWTVWRETAFTVAGHSKYADPELKRLYRSEDSGPVCCLILSQLVKFRNRGAAYRLALRGLQVLDADHFQMDYRPFLDENSVVGKSLIRMASLIRQLSDQEAKRLTHFLSQETRPACEIFIREIRRRNALLGDRSEREALEAAFERSWSAGLDQFVKKLLESSRDETNPRVQTVMLSGD